MNVPVISSRIGGVPEVVFDGQTGYMFEPGNSEQLAEAVFKLWTDQEAYRRICLQTREVITKRFNKEIQFDVFLEHFRSITGEQNGS